MYKTNQNQVGNHLLFSYKFSNALKNSLTLQVNAESSTDFRPHCMVNSQRCVKLYKQRSALSSVTKRALASVLRYYST